MQQTKNVAHLCLKDMNRKQNLKWKHESLPLRVFFILELADKIKHIYKKD